MTFFDRLRERIRATDGLLAVGLNPDRSRLPDDCRDHDYPRRAFNRRIVDATHEHVAAYTVNPAVYADREGWTALAETIAYARGRGVPVVLDAKYADLPDPDADLLGRADAVTVSPYLGRDALAGLLDSNLGVFVTCRTPNAGAADLQDRELAGSGADTGGGDESADGPTLGQRVADLAGDWAADAEADVGLLVGGESDDLEAIRERAPDRPFLAVGGARNDPEVAGHAAPESGPNAGLGLVEASREVLYAGETAGRRRSRGQDDHAAAARESARRLVRQLNRHR
ncbi:orotidine-5'-phosphate decarboxylase [Halorussus lipolyticus]|uniref:orotidine-5'-phosphate decarboxylase n=1 Tax=Halorussus lipolyticus TaxID=3034024 RepID=UPI0023E7F5A3|nr:orotidine-5'-phosphate decarboxylase [Halorussus sp. DT80]